MPGYQHDTCTGYDTDISYLPYRSIGMAYAVWKGLASSTLALGTLLGGSLGPGIPGPQDWAKPRPALAQSPQDEATTIRVYEQASPAVVAIDTRTGGGSGTIVDADGLILTNAHVVGGERVVTVRLADGRTFQGDVVGFGDNRVDLAAVRIRGNPANLPTVPVAAPNSVRVGQRAFAIGSPFGLQGTLTVGIVSRIDTRPGADSDRCRHQPRQLWGAIAQQQPGS
jgi:S1-C subfamily serine protease